MAGDKAGDPARSEVEYDGHHYDDFDWTKPLHSLGPNCWYCGSDGAEGHQNACRFLWKNQQTPAGRAFLRDEIKSALERERTGVNPRVV